MGTSDHNAGDNLAMDNHPIRRGGGAIFPVAHATESGVKRWHLHWLINILNLTIHGTLFT